MVLKSDQLSEISERVMKKVSHFMKNVSFLSDYNISDYMITKVEMIFLSAIPLKNL